MHVVERIQIALAYAIRFSILLAVVTSIFGGKWLTAFASALILVLTFLPSFMERNYKIHFPIEFEFAILIFIYGTLYLGEVQSFYQKFWWWDFFLHGMSGLLLGVAGFLLIYTLNREKKVKVDLAPIFIALFAFTFAVAAGAVWEIFEFSMDQLFGFSMQKNGLVDTMWDLIVDSVGALIAATAGFLYMKNKKLYLTDKLVNRFVSKNPHLFKKSN